jgi:glycosyltransferase involved in cell wall biosynthesis
MIFQKNLSSIIVPFYNEEATLENSVFKLVNEKFNKEIILVNDGSTDKSKDIASNLEQKYDSIRLINFKENRGKGFAVRTGIQESSGDIVGIFDADLEYSTEDLNDLIECIRKENTDFVCGSRFIGNKDRKNIYLRTFIANKLMSLLFSYVYKNKITDVATCLKVFKREVIEKINIEKDDFSIEIELLAKVISQTSNFKEIPISYNGRSYADGKKIKFLDGFKYIFAIFKFK